MDIKEFLKLELSGWTKAEKIFLPLILFVIVIISFYINYDSILQKNILSICTIIEAVFGILATIITGKGKISGYVFGIISVLLYAYIAWINVMYGLFALYILYYFPMDIIGIFEWKKHLKEKTNEVKKTYLSNKERFFITIITIFTSIALGYMLIYFKDKFPFIDAFAVITAIIAIYLTVKRCIEQWFVWMVYNSLNFIMCLFIVKSGGQIFATLLKWFIYFCLSFYFFFMWKKEIKYDK